MTDEEVFRKAFIATSLIIGPPIVIYIVQSIQKSNREIKDMKSKYAAEERVWKQRDVDEIIDDAIEQNELQIIINKIRNRKK